MTDSESNFGAQLGKTATRFTVAILALLLLKGVVASLPMLKHAPLFEGTLLSPLVLANAVVDTLIMATILGFGLALDRELNRFYPQLPDAKNGAMLLAVLFVIVVAYNQFELPLACVLTSPQDLMNLATGTGFDLSHMAPGLGEALRQITAGMSAEMSDALKNSTGNVLLAYQKLAIYKMRQSPDYYGLLFLIFAAVPVVGLVVIGSRNIDGISELLFRKASAVGARSFADTSSSSSIAQRKTVGATGGGGAKELSSEDMDKLIKLKTLLDQGAITQADFDAQKKFILHEPEAPDEPDELQKLKQLLDAGALTQEEFEIQKQRFLSRM